MNYGIMGWPAGNHEAHIGVPLARRFPDGSTNPLKFYGCFTKAFPVYICYVTGLSPASGSGNPYLRFSKDGANADAAANYYDGAMGGGLSNASQIDLGGGNALADPNTISGKIIIYDPLNTRNGLWKWVETTFMFNNSGGAPTAIARGGAYYNQDQPIRGMEIIYSVGGAWRANAGEAILYGVKSPHAYF